MQHTLSCNSVASGRVAHLQQRLACSQPRNALICHAGKGFGASTSKGFQPAKKAASKAPGLDDKCLCGSGKTYKDCCAKYHAGLAQPEAPEALLRSRFTAYASELVEYLADTTHPECSEYVGSRQNYMSVIRRTSRSAEFTNLQVVELKPGASDDEAFITFTLNLRRKDLKGQQPLITRSECSQFLKKDDRWLYFDSVECKDSV